MPTVSKDGKTYTFTMPKNGSSSRRRRPGRDGADFAVRDQPPANPKMQSPAAPFLSDIVGAQAMIDGKAKTVSGVTARATS